jgi:hypothetical protein
MGHCARHVKCRTEGDHQRVLFSTLTPSAICISEEYIASIHPEVREFNYQLCNWNFSLTHSFRPHYGPGIKSASKRSEHQQYFRCVGLTTLTTFMCQLS